MNRSLPMLAMIVLVGAAEVRAQDDLRAGPTIGYEFSVPLLLRRTEGAINYDPTFSGIGQSWSHSLLLGGTLFAPPAGAVGYSASLALMATSGTFRSDPFVPGLESADTAEFIAPDRYRRITVDMTAATLIADAQAHVGLFGLTAGAGLWTSLRVSGQFMRSERPEILPPDIAVEDATIVTGGDAIASYPMSYGALVSLGGTLAVSPAMTIRPEVSSRLDVVALRLGMGIRSMTIGAGVAVLFATSAPARELVAPPLAALDSIGATPPNMAPPAAPLRLDARIDLFADGDDSRSRPALVEPEEIVHRLVIALPRVVPYASNAFELPGGPARLSAEEARDFSARSLAGLDLAGHWRHYLDIVGLRLRETSAGTLALTGIAAGGEPLGLARVRAEVVRDYLVSVWQISPSRITIASERGGSPALRLDGEDAIFAPPLLSQWRTRRFRMPQLGLERNVVADAGVRHWTLEIEQGGRSLARFDSDALASEPEIDVRFIAGTDSTAPIAPIVATLAVEDSLGRTTIARDELPLQRAGGASAAARAERVELVAFDAALESASAAATRRLTAQRAARMLRDGAVVTISLVGDAGADARRRAADVAELGEALLAAANERGAHIARFVAGHDGDGTPVPGGIRIVVEQPVGESAARDAE